MEPLLRIELKAVTRGAGRRADGVRAYLRGTAVSAAAYRRGDRAEMVGDGRRRRFDYRDKRGVAYTETFAPGGAPEWARDSARLWQKVEAVEKRKDALLARELVITLPRDIALSRCLKHLRRWILDECVAAGMVADLAVHAYGTALDPGKEEQAKVIAETRASGIAIYPLKSGDRLRRMPPEHHHAWELPDGRLLVYQPHAHILLSTRPIGPEGFGLKERAWGRKARLYRWRQSWEAVCNRLLAEAGRSERVSAKARWKQAADARRKDGLLSDDEPTSPEPLRMLDLDGGIYAARDGRPAKQNHGEPDMTAFNWNENLKELRRREAAAQARRRAADHDRRDLIDAIVRMRELAEQGVEFVPNAKDGISLRGEHQRVTKEDQQKLGKQIAVLVPLLRSAPNLAPPPPIDDRLREAMDLIDRLQDRQGVRFFRTDKDALGFEPRDAVPPEVYNRFSGLHAPILAELKRREFAGLLREAEAERAQQREELVRSEERVRQLRQVRDEERESRTRLEANARLLIESATEGAPLPEASSDSPLLAGLRGMILGFRKKVGRETERADRAERVVATLKNGLNWMVKWVIRREPDFRIGLTQEHENVLRWASDAELAPEPPQAKAAGPEAPQQRAVTAPTSTSLSSTARFRKKSETDRETRSRPERPDAGSPPPGNPMRPTLQRDTPQPSQRRQRGYER